MIELQDWLDGEDFYNLMQSYRNSSVVQQEATAKAFEEVKTAIAAKAREVGLTDR